MLLHLVEPESSRTLCCKVYIIKRIGVVFKWFYPTSAFRENNLCESVVFTHVVLVEAVFIEV